MVATRRYISGALCWHNFGPREVTTEGRLLATSSQLRASASTSSPIPMDDILSTEDTAERS